MAIGTTPICESNRKVHWFASENLFISHTEMGSAPPKWSGAPAPAPGLKMERRSRSRSDFQKGAALPLPLRTKRSAAPFSAPTLILGEILSDEQICAV